MINSILPKAIRQGSVLLLFVVACSWSTSASGQQDAFESELVRLRGPWRVVEMIDDGRTISPEQMRQWLPGGGVMEIIDTTILFQSPSDGTKSTKTFRVDPTTYPKQIAILNREITSGAGIYKFDSERLVLCITRSVTQRPSQFSAPAGSNRSLMVLERFDPTADRKPATSSTPSSVPIVNKTEPVSRQVPTQPASARTPPPTTDPLAKSAKSQAAAQVLTDDQVRKMLVGAWRINDSEGSVDIVFDASGSFQTYRYSQAITNFQTIFLPTPVSSGSWSISGGRLTASVKSSTRFDRVNQTFIPAVRSISATDLILVDHLGRVSRAVKVR